jgi:hypothetical protein
VTGCDGARESEQAGSTWLSGNWRNSVCGISSELESPLGLRYTCLCGRRAVSLLVPFVLQRAFETSFVWAWQRRISPSASQRPLGLFSRGLSSPAEIALVRRPALNQQTFS